MPQEMTAVRFHEYGGSDKLIVEKILRAQPKAGEVLIKVHYAGVNPVDWKFRAGYLKGRPSPWVTSRYSSVTIAHPSDRPRVVQVERQANVLAKDHAIKP